MEQLIVLILIGFVLSSISKSNKQKTQQKKGAQTVQRQTVQRQTVQRQTVQKPAVQKQGTPKQSMQEFFDQSEPVSMPVRKLQPMPQPAQPRQLTMMDMPEAAAAPARPAPIAPSVQVTHHTDDIFEGSMAMASTEGYDPCHEDELHEAVNPCELAPDDTPAETAPAISLDWNGNALVKAMVMQEVLTRPCDRARR